MIRPNLKQHYTQVSSYVLLSKASDDTAHSLTSVCIPDELRILMSAFKYMNTSLRRFSHRVRKQRGQEAIDCEANFGPH